MNLSQSLTTKLDTIQSGLSDDSNAMKSSEDDLRSMKLQAIIRSFDKPPRLGKLSELLDGCQFSQSQQDSTDSEWFVLARAAIVVVHSLMEELFDRTAPIGQDIMYWEQILSSRLWRTLYTIQTSPRRLWQFSHALATKLRSQVKRESLTLSTLQRSIFDQALLRHMSFPHLSGKSATRSTRLLSFDSLIKQEIRAKVADLVRMRDIQAQAIGLMVTRARVCQTEDLSQEVTALVNLLEFSATYTVSNTSSCEDDAVLTLSRSSTESPDTIASKLIALSENFRPQRKLFAAQLKDHCRPSILTRYWPAGLAFYLVGSMTLNFFTSRKRKISLWAGDMLGTAQGFWSNWILEPTRQILATIRHDKGSEVALLSSRSLGADLESLERMVVEFAQDNPQYSSATSLHDLKLSARNGDLTPVLIAYESNIKSPLRSVVTGSLIRSLLIQIQKTKVDVEVAINGIDKLLKSQELVFGFVGVSPALALAWIFVQWLTTVSGRKGRASSNQLKIGTIKTLRNVDRLLCTSHGRGSLTYKRRGLVLCEAQTLKLCADCVDSALRDQYCQDLEDLESAEDLETMRSVLQRLFRVYVQRL